MITARVRRTAEVPVNKKKIHRILKLNQWQCRQRPQGHRPRAHGWVSRATQPNERWAIDATHLFCGRDGWCHLTAIIDCYDDRRLAAVAVWDRQRRGSSARRGAPEPEDQHGRPSAGAALGQRPRLRRESLREGGQTLRRAARVHYPVHATAEWDDRALLPDAE